MVNFVYILASRPGGAIYIGRTRNLRARVEAHRAGLSEHTATYNIRTLVWFEQHAEFETSLLREHRLKRWRRAWKDQLIMEHNPQWRDITHLVPE
ncbi:MAG: GIY-YIG nuclease family protein [Rhodobacteraceae bacterium]|nr:MAG: GIY-YIG nuclease family protein [Paracoccaceae bacterium]